MGIEGGGGVNMKENHYTVRKTGQDKKQDFQRYLENIRTETGKNSEL